MTKTYQLDVNLKEQLGQEVFNESYQIQLPQTFVENTHPKEHGLKNHVRGFVEKLKQNSIEVLKQSYHKRQVYVVNYGMNTGSEINGNRPSIIYKDTHNTQWDDVIVIPLTSAIRQKQADKFDVYVAKNDVNKLYQNSYARLRQIRSVSIKRLGKALGTITDEKVKQEINEGIKKMLAMDK